MSKTSVYTLVNGNMQSLIHRKQQKSWKGDITHHHIVTVNVLLNNITFLWFLLFSMCQSLHVAINKCINWCFVHLYLLFHSNNKVLCWWSIINHLLSMAMMTQNLKYFGVTILIFRVHVTSLECDHQTRREHFPIGGQWWPCVYLARVRKYKDSKLHLPMLKAKSSLRLLRVTWPVGRGSKIPTYLEFPSLYCLFTVRLMRLGWRLRVVCRWKFYTEACFSRPKRWLRMSRVT